MMPDLAARVGGWIRPPGRRWLAAFASLSAATQLDAVLSFATSVVLVRVSGAEVAGQVFLAQALASVWFTFWDPRFDDAAQRFIPVHQTTGPGYGTGLFRRLMWFDVTAGAGATILGVASAALLGLAGWAAVDPGFVMLAMVAAGAAAPLGTAWAGYAAIDRIKAVGGLRVAASGLSFPLTLTALFLDGPGAFLAMSAATALLTTAVMVIAAKRAVVAVLGPPPSRAVPTPPGLVRFAVKCSITTSIAGAADQGLVALAGILGGPSLAAFLKIASAPGRLYLSFVSAVPAQLFPRMAAAAVARNGAAIRRDGMRATVLLALVGLFAGVAGAPVTGAALSMIYGEEYRWLAPAAVVLLLASCVHGFVAWGKVFTPALGRPGVRLGYVTVEGVLRLAMFVLIAEAVAEVATVPYRFAWAELALAVLRATTWLVLLHTLTSEMEAERE